MNIVVIGCGNVGGGPAALSRQAGHQVTALGRNGARQIAEQQITDAGYDPVPLGGLDKARAAEDLSWLPVAAMIDGSPIFYRFAVPGQV